MGIFFKSTAMEPKERMIFSLVPVLLETMFFSLFIVILGL